MDEETKQRLLEELRKEYTVTLKPLKELKFSVSDILEKYYDDICIQVGVNRGWKYTEAIGCVIRKIMCYHYGVYTLQEIPADKRLQFREDTEKFIKEFILGEVKYGDKSRRVC